MKTVMITITVLAALTPTRADAVGMRIRGSREVLRLVRHDVKVRVEHPVAVVSIIQEFENPLPRAVEGDYRYQLPAGAVIDDLGLWVNGVRRPARMLERQRAKEIYEGIVRQKRDPALVERTASGLYRVRIFPVLPKQRTRIELRYTQLSPHHGGGTYRLRIHQAGKVPLRIEAVVADAPHLRDVRLRGYRGTLQRQPAGWMLAPAAAAREVSNPVVLEYRLQKVAAHAVVEQRAEGRYLVAVLPRPRKAHRPAKTALLVDVSTSMQAHWKAAKRLCAALADSLGQGRKPLLVPLSLAPRVRSMDELNELEPRGGSALLPAFELATQAGATHLVIVTDGFSSAYQAEIEHLARVAYDLKREGKHAGVRVSVVQLGKESVNRASLENLARATGGHYLAGERRDESLVAAIDSSPAPTPWREDGGVVHLLAQRSESVVIATRLFEQGIPRLHFAGQSFSLESRSTTHGPATLWGAAEIAVLQQEIRLFGQEERLRPRIVALSQRLRVASEYTALLVTEKDADYDRPTSGRVWQRRVQRMGQNVPAPLSYHATPEPHEWAMIALALVMLYASRRHRLRLPFARRRR